MLKKLGLPLVGAVVAIFSVILVVHGNPGNMGFCIACFLRDTAGAMGLHGAVAVQYARPEVLGIVLGALIVSLIRKEFSPKGGSAPITRFVLGMCVMIGALIFLGCPLRMLLRIAGGDLNALVGLVGFVGGVGLGAFFLKKGYSLKKTQAIAKTDGFVLPAFSILLLVALIFFPALLLFSEGGPGSMRAPLVLALVAGLVMGGLGFISRICFSGGVRDGFLLKDFSFVAVFGTLIVVAIVGNIITGEFSVGFEGQPIAHTEWIWNILGLALVGFGSVLLAGCPFRQMVLAGSGNSDSTITVFGMIFGAAVAHNFGLASSGAGTTTSGRVAFAIAAVVMVLIAVYNTFIKIKKVSTVNE